MVAQLAFCPSPARGNQPGADVAELGGDGHLRVAPPAMSSVGVADVGGAVPPASPLRFRVDIRCRDGRTSGLTSVYMCVCVVSYMIYKLVLLANKIIILSYFQ